MQAHVVRAFALPALVMLTVACGRDLRPDVRSAIEAELQAASLPRAVRGDVQAFYDARDGAPAWMGRRAPSSRAAAGIRTLALAGDHGFDPEDYGRSELDRARGRLVEDDAGDDQTRGRELARFDVELSAALLALGRDVALQPAARGNVEGKGRDTADFGASLARALDDDLLAWLDAVRPQHPEYAALQRALGDLRAERGEAEWPRVEARALEPGDRGPGVESLRARLAASRDLATSRAAGTAYDDDVRDAVAAFQERHGLAADGVAGPDTIAALNVPLAARMRQMAVNLARWRSLPDDLGSPHILVNIPAFELAVREDGRDALTMRVIVGAPTTPTPTFADRVETVVFSPFWHIPESIALGETAPKAAADADYLRRQRIDVLRTGQGAPELIDPADVNWDDPEEVRNLALRQRPGPGNALGHVKFLFPNRYSVYLHDTPDDALFERSSRALSHGCVRVGEPQALAEFVLGDDPAWTGERIAEAMTAGTAQHVAVPAAVPVYLAYFTARVGPDGRVGFLPDVYGYDR